MSEINYVQAIVCLFYKHFSDDEIMRNINISIPAYLLEQDFHDRMQSVMLVRSRLTSWKWRYFFDTYFHHMLSSHEMFVTFVMFACYRENECHQNKFERFLSVLALVKLLSEETFQKTGVNFSVLNTDIFGVFFRSVMQDSFFRRGGLMRLVAYIRNHRFLTWKESMDFAEKRDKELKREGKIEIETYPNDVAKDMPSKYLANILLKKTSFKIPVLPSSKNLIESVLAYMKKKLPQCPENLRIKAVEKLEVVEVDVHRCSSSNSDSKTDCVAKLQDNIEWHDSIIQAVTKFNHSKSSKYDSSNSQIQVGAEVLKDLKDKIACLIEILEKCDKE